MPHLTPLIREAKVLCGLRPFVADGLLLIGQAPGASNVYMNAGPGFNGWKCALGVLTISLRFTITLQDLFSQVTSLCLCLCHRRQCSCISRRHHWRPFALTCCFIRSFHFQPAQQSSQSAHLLCTLHVVGVTVKSSSVHSPRCWSHCEIILCTLSTLLESL
jgi:hypothetical protein